MITTAITWHPNTPATLPDADTLCLVHCPDADPSILFASWDGEHWVTETDEWPDLVSHWADIPSPDDPGVLPRSTCATENAVIAKLQHRGAAGRRKYRHSMDRTDLTPQQWAIHLQEELLDAVQYLERLLPNRPTTATMSATIPCHFCRTPVIPGTGGLILISKGDLRGADPIPVNQPQLINQGETWYPLCSACLRNEPKTP